MRTIEIGTSVCAVWADETAKHAYQTPNGGWVIDRDAPKAMRTASSPDEVDDEAKIDTYRDIVQVGGLDYAVVGTMQWNAEEWSTLEVLRIEIPTRGDLARAREAIARSSGQTEIAHIEAEDKTEARRLVAAAMIAADDDAADWTDANAGYECYGDGWRVHVDIAGAAR